MWCTEEGTPRIMKSAKQNPNGTAKVFLLSADDSVSVFVSESHARKAMAEGDLLFGSAAELKGATDGWPGARLVNVWNGVPGVVRIKKFTDRSTAVQRIWHAIQNLEPAPTPEDNHLPAGMTEAKPRSGTKRAALLELLARPEGASVREIMVALGWQSHSVRGCLSTLSRQKSAGIHSFRRSDGERAYSTSPASEQGGAQ